MTRLRVVLLIPLLLAATPAAAHHGVGTDLMLLNLCLYGDCEARGSYAADPYGLYNPAVMPLLGRDHLSRGGAASGSYYDLDIGSVDGDVGVGVATVSWHPVVVQVATAYAEARGPIRPLPGVDMRFRTTAVRLAAGIDMEAAAGLRGLSLGLAGVVPGTESDLELRAGGRTFVRSSERRELELIPGIHWRAGERDWFMAGAFLDATRNDMSARGFDPVTFTPLRRDGTTNAWFTRVGTSMLPFVPLGLVDDRSARGQWLGYLRVGIDVEYRNVTIPDEGTHTDAAAYFGADGLLLPDAWNPLKDWVRLWWLAGVDTRGGWGAGAGLYGQGPLEWLGCNQAYSSRTLTDFLGDRVGVFAITCSAMVPF